MRRETRSRVFLMLGALAMSATTQAAVVITEIMYNPAGDDGWSPGNGNTEYIEILNVGPGTVNVQGWIVCDSQGTCMPASGIGSIGVLATSNDDFMLAPGEFAVLITEDTALGSVPCIADFKLAWNVPNPPAAEIIVLAGYNKDRSVQLNNTATDVPLQLYDGLGSLADQCSYPGAVAQGVGLYICTSPLPTTASNDSPADWKLYDPANPIPSPGMITSCNGDSVVFGADMGTPGRAGITTLCGATCSLTVTAPPTPVSADVSLDLDVPFTASPPVGATISWSTDAGATWSPCTMAAASPNPNPLTGLTVGVSPFVWDSIADGVGVGAAAATMLRAAIVDGAVMYSCTVSTMVDNRPPAPTCVILTPMAGTTAGNDVSVGFDLGSSVGIAADATLEWSTDSGSTWLLATMDVSSALTNPALGVPLGSSAMVWDSRSDGLGLAASVPVDLRITVADDSPRSPTDCASAIDVDNTVLCTAGCGDCDLNSLSPSVLDALAAAQISAGVTMALPLQQACCDVDSSLSISVIDALLMAQAAAGLAVVLSCP